MTENSTSIHSSYKHFNNNQCVQISAGSWVRQSLNSSRSDHRIARSALPYFPGGTGEKDPELNLSKTRSKGSAAPLKWRTLAIAAWIARNLAFGSEISPFSEWSVNLTCWGRPLAAQINLGVFESHFTLYTLHSFYQSELVENIKLWEYRPLLRGTNQSHQMHHAFQFVTTFHC